MQLGALHRSRDLHHFIMQFLAVTHPSEIFIQKRKNVVGKS